MSRPLTVVTTGLAATFPFGGVFWDYLQYALGLRRLGHHVLYLEDPARYAYDPEGETFVADGSANAARLARALGRLDFHLAGAWSYRDSRGRVHGRPWEEVVRTCREADLFLNLSGSCLMREEYFAARRVVFLDSDPMYTQGWVEDFAVGRLEGDALWRALQVRRHDCFLTFAESVGREGCKVPTALFDWRPTRQPIVLDCFPAAAARPRRAVLTTVLSWEPREGGPVVGGVAYGGKARELERFLGLPRRSALPIELAVSGRAPLERLTAAGFQVVPAYPVSSDPWVYRDYLAASAGEWSVAKQAYVASRSGWFSCRSACYLALGVPVVAQDTGFRDHLPTGEGLFAFADEDEAADAIARIAREPERQARAARRVAEECFDARRVLGRLIGEARG